MTARLTGAMALTACALISAAPAGAQFKLPEINPPKVKPPKIKLPKIKLPSPKKFFRIENNKAAVRAAVKRGGYYVAYGKEIKHIDYAAFAGAVGASVAAANPGPAMAYLKYIVSATKRQFVRNLKRQGRRFGADTLRRFERMLLESLHRAIKGGRPLRARFQGFDLTLGVATYKHWKKVTIHTPYFSRGKIKWRKHSQTVKLPPTLQPYVKWRVRVSAR